MKEARARAEGPEFSTFVDGLSKKEDNQSHNKPVPAEETAKMEQPVEEAKRSMWVEYHSSQSLFNFWPTTASTFALFLVLALVAKNTKGKSKQTRHQCTWKEEGIGGHEYQEKQ